MSSNMIDIRPEVGVQVEINEDGSIIWVNVDGKCVCRVQGIEYMELQIKNDKIRERAAKSDYVQFSSQEMSD